VSTVAVSATVFAAVFGCAILGLLVRRRLPDHHLGADARDVMKLSLGLVATMAALVLGLLTASAKRSYDTEGDAVMDSAAQVIVLDRTLARYGPETQPIREGLHRAIARRLAVTWPEDGSSDGWVDVPDMTGATERLDDAIRALAPATDTQRELRAKALDIAGKLLDIRWMVFTRARATLPTIFLVMLIFWVAILFAGFGLLAPSNATVVVTFALCAVAVSGSIFLILEMNDPFSGWMKISGDPLRYALQLVAR
jgi:hypothetical protein